MARASQFEANRAEVLGSIADPAHGKPPSVRDLAQRVNVSPSTMHTYLTKLSDEGLIEWKQGRHRTLQATPEGHRQLAQSHQPSP